MYIELLILMSVIFGLAFLLSTIFGTYVDYLYDHLKRDWVVTLFIILPTFILLYGIGAFMIWLTTK